MCPNFVLPLIAWYKDSRMFCDAPDWLDRTPACFVTPLIGCTEFQLVCDAPDWLNQNPQLVLWGPWLVGQNPSLFCDAPDWLDKKPSLFCDAPDWLDRIPACSVTPLIGWSKPQLVLWRPWLVGQNVLWRPWLVGQKARLVSPDLRQWIKYLGRFCRPSKSSDYLTSLNCTQYASRQQILPPYIFVLKGEWHELCKLPFQHQSTWFPLFSQLRMEKIGFYACYF